MSQRTVADGPAAQEAVRLASLSALRRRVGGDHIDRVLDHLRPAKPWLQSWPELGGGSSFLRRCELVFAVEGLYEVGLPLAGGVGSKGIGSVAGGFSSGGGGSEGIVGV